MELKVHQKIKADEKILPSRDLKVACILMEYISPLNAWLMTAEIIPLGTVRHHLL